MKYKVLKGNNLFSKLEEIIEKMELCNSASTKLAKELGAEEALTYNNWFRAGGAHAFYFSDENIPNNKLWKKVKFDDFIEAFYFPREGKKFKVNDPIHEKIKNLPTITFEEFNDIISFNFGFRITEFGIQHDKTYGLIPIAEAFLIQIPEGMKFIPIEGMIEILESEFLSLTPIKK